MVSQSKSRSNSPEGTPESERSENQRTTTKGPQSHQDDASPEAVNQTATVPPQEREGQRRHRSRTGAATHQGRSGEDEDLTTPASKVPSKGQGKKRSKLEQEYEDRLHKIVDSLSKFKKLERTEERRQLDLTKAGPVGRPPDGMNSTPLPSIESPTDISSPLETPTLPLTPPTPP